MAPEKQEIQAKQRNAADKAELLAQNAENKIRMFLRQESQIGLRSFPESLSKKAAAANRHFGLYDLISAPFGSRIGSTKVITRFLWWSSREFQTVMLA